MSEKNEGRGKEFLHNVPFAVGPGRFFYGWAVLALGTLGVLASAPGQTIGVSVFTDFLIRDHSISRNELSFAYFLGTIGSAFLIATAGKWYDRWGGRWLATLAATMLAIVLVELSFSVQVASLLKEWFPADWGSKVSFGVLAVSFLALRFFGQGVLTLSSRNMVMEWFEKRRGFAMAFIGISIAFGFSIAPRVFESAIQYGGWQWAWRAIAAAVAVFAVAMFCIGRARPEDHDLKPDGPYQESATARKVHKETEVGRQFTLNEARCTYSFWIFTLSAMMSGLLLTAFTFHLVSIFQEVGVGREAATAIFVPVAFVSVTVEFVGSWLSDFLKLKYLAAVQLFGIVLLSLSIFAIGNAWAYYGIIVGAGLMRGMFGIISGVTWPRFFGRTHLGAISGFSTSVVVAGTAVGPLLFSMCQHYLGGYHWAALVCAIVGGVLLLGSFSANRPQ